MNDIKNILLAWVSSASSLFAAIEYRELITIISALVLPVVFFTIGKTVDVAVQVYLDRRRRAVEDLLGKDTSRDLPVRLRRSQMFVETNTGSEDEPRRGDINPGR